MRAPTGGAPSLGLRVVAGFHARRLGLCEIPTLLGRFVNRPYGMHHHWVMHTVGTALAAVRFFHSTRYHGFTNRRGRRPRRPAGERSLPLRSLRITVGLCKNPTVLGRARKVSPAGSVALLHTSVCRGLHRRPAPRPYEVGASPLGCADFCGRMMASAPTESASPLGCVNFVGAPRSSPPTGLCAPTVAVLFLPVFLD